MKSLALSLLLVLVSPRVVTAQDTTATLWTREVINSAKLKESRRFLVAVPDNYGTSKDRYPVLVIMDADDQPQFKLAIASVAFLASRG